ncbi:MAG: glycosyltransferase family 39 protein [Terriglobia bacterium]
MAAAVAWFNRSGATLYSGDAEAHLNIARRIVDSRTPGWDQLGTTWLPLPHLLMLPFVRNDWLWQTGLAGAIPSAICTALATAFLFAAVRRIFGSALSASVAAAVFLLNPNTLYLGSVPMMEPVLFASLCALLFFTVRFTATRGWGSLAGAALAACAGTLTRYEVWFLLPFIAAYIWIKGGERRWLAAAFFCAVAGAGPALWLAHNRWYFGDALYFYRGPWSAMAIQGRQAYPGKGDWRAAAQYYFTAGELIASLPGLLLGAAGTIIALSRRAFWPILLLTLPPAFYIWSIHSSGTPIHVPSLWPHAWYNIRYAMALLPLIALGAAAIARFGRPAAALAVVVALGPFLIHPRDHAITWQEAEINSRGRREWTAQAVAFLRSAAGPHETFFTSFGDLTAIYRTAGIHLRDTLTGDNGVEFLAASSLPQLMLHTDWAVVMGGDEVQGAIDKARLHGPRYELSDRIILKGPKGQPVIEIYHRKNESPLR